MRVSWKPNSLILPKVKTASLGIAAQGFGGDVVAVVPGEDAVVEVGAGKEGGIVERAKCLSLHPSKVVLLFTKLEHLDARKQSLKHDQLSGKVRVNPTKREQNRI